MILKRDTTIEELPEEGALEDAASIVDSARTGLSPGRHEGEENNRVAGAADAAAPVAGAADAAAPMAGAAEAAAPVAGAAETAALVAGAAETAAPVARAAGTAALGAGGGTRFFSIRLTRGETLSLVEGLIEFVVGVTTR